MPDMPTRILIVEDDPDIAALVARYLDKAGFTTERVASGRDALQTIAARPPELLVLDLMLPQVDGLEVCRLVRADEAADLETVHLGKHQVDGLEVCSLVRANEATAAI